MKRKDLEEKINNWLDNAEEITGKTILDFLEKEGMKPPATIVEKYHKGQLYLIEVNEWEN